MRTLRDFLLAEAKEDENKDDKNSESSTTNKQLPDGFTVVSNRGSLTKEAQEAMGAQNWNSAMDIAATKNPKKIKDKLGSVSGTGVYAILKSIMANNNDLDEVFKKEVGKVTQIEDSCVLQFKSNDWQTLAKTSSSSQRLVKFWISSALTAYGVEGVSKKTFAVNEDTDQFIVF